MAERGAAGTPVQRQLRDALERILRSVGSRAGWALLVLRLSRLPAPGPLPHHRRVAAALLDEAAERCTGQLFGLANGDLALLFRPGDDGAGVLGLIASLFGADGAEVEPLRSLWRLPEEAEAAQAYVSEPAVLPPWGPEAGADAERVTVAPDAPLAAVMVRGTAVRLRAEAGHPILPLFREVGVAAESGLQASAAAGLEQRLLVEAREAMDTGHPMFAGPSVPLNLPLTPAGILSMGFAKLASVRAVSGRPMLVELPLSAAFADAGTFVLARERLRLTGMRFVLGGVSRRWMGLCRPEVLAPDLVKLAWEPALRGGAGVAEALGRLGPQWTVLTGCDTEAAVAWGLENGVQRFQGGFVDTMLAVRRLRACPAGRGCSVGLCRGRAASLEPGVRGGCRNLALLDAAVTGGS